MAAIILVAFFLSSAILTLGQRIGFEEADLTVSDSSVVRINVLKEFNNAPLDISLHPLTISQYQSSGFTGCLLSSSSTPAGVDDFNDTVLNEIVPANIDRTTYMFEIALTEDDVVEPDETFVVLLKVSGGDSTLFIARNCIVINVQENFKGKFLQWTHNSQEVTSQTLSLNYPEGNGSYTILRVERLVKAEVTTTITAVVQSITSLEQDEFSIASSYSIPPNRSYVDIVLTLFDDDITEDDELIQIECTASVPQFNLGTNRNRHVKITILDDEVLNYVFLSGDHVQVTEGDSFNISSGLKPKVTNLLRSNLFGRITSENGTAKEGVDFYNVNSLFRVSNQNSKVTTVRTISRTGVQPSRTFTIHLTPILAFGIRNNTNIHGIITVEVLDNSLPPLAPSVNAFGFFKKDSDDLQANWTQQISDVRPVENFLVIIKTCTKRPCEIDPDIPKEDEKIGTVSSDTREVLQTVNSKTGVFGVVVCAMNVLGKNCSTIVLLEGATNVPIIMTATPIAVVTEKPDETFIVWVVVLCVLVFLICCLLPLILLLLCCWYKREQERSYYPSKKMGRELKGKSPDSTDSNSIDSYLEEMKYSELKYVS